jgi:hypothetical protein
MERQRGRSDLVSVAVPLIVEERSRASATRGGTLLPASEARSRPTCKDSSSARQTPLHIVRDPTTIILGRLRGRYPNFH